MQPQFIKVPDAASNSFLVRDMVVPYFYNPYHFHPELELTYIIEGSGTRYVGDSLSPFTSGDLILIGSNLAHQWKNDRIYNGSDSELMARAIVVQFREDFLGQQLLALPEMIRIKQLLESAKQGVRLHGEVLHKVAQKMLAIVKEEGAARIASLISILDVIANTKEYSILTSKGFVNSYYNNPDVERINAVYTYVMTHLTEEITLNQIAEVAKMSPTAFCRYFKNTTHKVFSSFLIETRISYACKLLSGNAMPIMQVSYESGFNSFSYFIRQFKKTTGYTPFNYRKKFLPQMGV